jgi:hypothetical protein
MTITLLIIAGVFVILAGASEAVMDKLQFHWHKSIFAYDPNRYPELFWNPEKSWENKYADKTWTTPKFPGSTSIFVALTDAWHLFKSIRTFLISISIFLVFISGYYYPTSYENNVILFAMCSTLILRVLYGFAFTLFYRVILHFEDPFGTAGKTTTAGNAIKLDWMDKINGLK